MTMREWLVLGALLACWGCGDGSAQELEEHQQEWLSKHPNEYVVEICGTGFACCCELSAVSDGKVVAARQGLRGGMLMDVAPGSEEPIAAMFERVSRGLGSDDCDLESLAFDPEYSYVSDYYFDCDSEGSGEKVSCFKPDTVDLSACSK